MDKIRESCVPAILVINKIDTVRKEELLAVIKTYSDAFDFDGIIPISARKGDGVQLLTEELKKYRLDVPQVTELAWELKKKGIPLPDGILRKSELLDALVPLLKEE